MTRSELSSSLGRRPQRADEWQDKGVPERPATGARGSDGRREKGASYRATGPYAGFPHSVSTYSCFAEASAGRLNLLLGFRTASCARIRLDPVWDHFPHRKRSFAVQHSAARSADMSSLSTWQGHHPAQFGRMPCRRKEGCSSNVY
jgi:hypothetical protein